MILEFNFLLDFDFILYRYLFVLKNELRSFSANFREIDVLNSPLQLVHVELDFWLFFTQSLHYGCFRSSEFDFYT